MVPSRSSSGAGTEASPSVEAVEDFLSLARLRRRPRMTARTTNAVSSSTAAPGTHPITIITSRLIPDPVPRPRPRVGSENKK